MKNTAPTGHYCEHVPVGSSTPCSHAATTSRAASSRVTFSLCGTHATLWDAHEGAARDLEVATWRRQLAAARTRAGQMFCERRLVALGVSA